VGEDHSMDDGAIVNQHQDADAGYFA